MFLKKTNPFLIEFVQYGLVVLNSIILLFYIFHLWKIGMDIPLLASTGDALSVSYYFKTIMETGWVFTNPSTGAPFGAHFLIDYPGSDSFQYLIGLIFSLVFHDSFVIYNLYYLAGFPLAAVSAFYVLKKLGIPFFIALPGSIAFAFLPFHLLRYGHLFLASYYMIPLGLLVIFDAVNGHLSVVTPNEQGHRALIHLNKPKCWFYLLICIITASTGVYYAFFLACIGLISILRCFFLKDAVDKSLRIKICFVFVAAMLLTAAINAAPTYINNYVEGGSPEILNVRLKSEAEIYGLKIIQLLLPSRFHRFPILANITQTYNLTTPLVNENETASLGLIGAVGFLYSLVILFLQQKKKDELLDYLSIINLFCVLLGTIGGFSSIIAFFIFSSIRGYNRISVIIGFLSIAIFCRLIQHLTDIVKGQCFLNKGGRNLVFSIVVSLFLLSIVFVDQCYVPDFLPKYRQIQASYENDKSFAQNIVKTLPKGSMIFQLPFMAYPENGPINKMTDYDHFRPYILTSGLRWSYGDTRGRKSSVWNISTSQLPIEQMLQRLAAAGFSGIYVDRFGYADEGKQVEREISSYVNITPIISNDQRLAFYDLREYANTYRSQFSEDRWQMKVFEALHISSLSPEGECSLLEGKPGNQWIWCGDQGKMVVYDNDYNSQDRSVKLNFEVSTGTGETADLTIGIGSDQKKYQINGKPKSIEIIIPMKKMQTTQMVLIESDAHSFHPDNGDPRELVLLLRNPTISLK